MSQGPRTLLSIQYLRGLAALAVGVAHVAWTNWLWGQQGVDVFFVISGFIMAHVASREADPATFLRARVLRVVPLYAVVTLAWWIGHPAMTPVHVALSLAFVPHLGPEGMIWPVIWQGWTLLYEAFFYAAFAAALLLPPRLRLPLLSGGFAVLAGIGAVSGSNAAAAQVYLSPLLLEFLAGAWLHEAWARGWLARPAWGIAAATLAGLALVATRNIEPGDWRILMWGVPCLMLVGAGLAMESILPRVPLLLALGNWSYAIYLTHRFVLPYLMAAFHPLPTPLALTGVMAGCAALGALVHLGVERPLTQLLRHRRPVLPATAQ